MARRIAVIASAHTTRPDATIPPGVFRAFAYEAEDKLREPLWTCEHDHRSAQDAALCGAEWLASQGESAQEQ
jgi:hypothetical protein